MSPTRVLVDGGPLYDSGRFRGMGMYLRSLLVALGSEPQLSVTALVVEGTPVPSGISARVIRRSGPGRVAHLEHVAKLMNDVRRTDHDVFHSPGLEPPLWCPKPWVQVVYDVIPLIFDDPGFQTVRRRWRRRAQRMRSASALVAISKHTADESVRVLGLDPKRMHVIPLGVSPQFRPPADRVMPDPPFVLYVGEFGPSKGFPEAFEVVSRLAASGYPHRLKMVGRIAPWVRADVDRLVATSGRPDRIDLLGYVADEELVGLYQCASALIVTSRYEGFGLPALEAMATGTPVVAFRNSSIPEVVGDAGALVADGDVPAFVAALHEVLSNDFRWEELSERALDRAQRFDWRTCAERHSEVFELVSRYPSG